MCITLDIFPLYFAGINLEHLFHCVLLPLLPPTLQIIAQIYHRIMLAEKGNILSYKIC